MKRKARERYSENDLIKAIAEVKNGTCTYRKASEKYGIPIATLCDKIKLRVQVTAKTGMYNIRKTLFFTHWN